ncbi:DivIVA domain-containing protein [Marininema halotolerans]|uniref:Cell division initiation protein n=1 Tax=Marininema halotolerans TaxID=1155944 RepID=A0A1I6SWT2_9BACL|nr:DivIVA domain-containing protein [Marininema halotolerans]SFS81360.1 cell division initiation protein [Marininema halotolerans]
MERLTPRDIFNKDFKTTRKGYNVDEVNEFLDVVIKNFEDLLEENLQLKEELKKERKTKIKQGPGNQLNQPMNQISATQPSMSPQASVDSDRKVEDLMRRLDRLEEYIRRRG